MSKYQLSDGVRMEVLGYIKDYERRKMEYKQKCREILDGTPCRFETLKDVKKDGNSVEYRIYHSGGGGGVGNPTEDKAIQLESLSHSVDYLHNKAVEQAYDLIGENIASNEIRLSLQKGIWLNCLSGRSWNYENLRMPTVSRKEFYQERRRFLYMIAKFANLV